MLENESAFIILEKIGTSTHVVQGATSDRGGVRRQTRETLHRQEAQQQGPSIQTQGTIEEGEK